MPTLALREVSKVPEMDISASFSILGEAVILRDTKGFRDSTPSSDWASSGTHAPHQSRTLPLLPGSPITWKEGDLSLMFIWLLQTSPFPPVPPPATMLWHQGNGQVYSVKEQRSKDPGIWHGTRERALGLAEGHFVHIMYYMGSGLQPENNLLFLLFPY